ncbi:DNA-directed RNA polymerase II subunit RPB2 [Boothiomyces sp. JEL0866]|nr:DNA-directed RNA polymerase II subunit RPB2 [Boothiomyces sp. JEL0866]
MDYYESFFDEYGYMANIDIIYHNSVKRIKDTLKEYFFFEEDEEIFEKIPRSEDECLLTKTSYIKEFYLKSSKYKKPILLLYIPYITKHGYYIVDGIEWAITGLDIRDKKFNQIEKMNEEKDSDPKYVIETRYKHQAVEISTLINTFNMFENNQKNTNNNQIEAFIVYLLLKFNEQINYSNTNDIKDIKTEFIDKILYFCKPKDHKRVKIFLDIYLLSFNNSVYNLCTEHISVFNKSKLQNIDEVLRKMVYNLNREFLQNDDIQHTTILTKDESGKYNINVNYNRDKSKFNKYKNEYNDEVRIIETIDDEVQKKFDKNRIINDFCYKISCLLTYNDGDENPDLNLLIHKKIDVFGFMLERSFVEKIILFLNRFTKYDFDKKKRLYNRTNLFDDLKDFSSDMLKNIKNGKIMSYYKIHEKVNVQVLSKRNLLDVYSHIRKIELYSINNNSNIEVILLKSDNYGYLCPVETADSEKSGYIKYLALSVIISDYIDFEKIEDFFSDVLNKDNLQHFDDNKINLSIFSNKTKKLLFVNDLFYGIITVDEFNKLRNKRNTYKYKYYKYISISEYNNNYYIFTNRGRLIRPLINNETGKIVYIDQYEINDINYQIRFENDKSGTHREINNALVLGLSASVMPFINHNQGARSLFQANMSKQTHCNDITLYKSIVDGSRSLWFGQKDLINTYISKKFFNQPNYEICNGHNILTAMMTYEYNVDDAIVFKRESIQRGLFGYDKIKTYNFVIENKSHIKKRINFDKFTKDDVYHDDGIILNYPIDDIGYRYDSNNIIKKHCKVKSKETLLSYDQDIIDKHKNTLLYDSIVKKIIKQKNDDNYNICIILEKSNYVKEGDKFASRSAQKGIVAKIIDEVNLPYTKKGLTPDLIINPHSIPSRMTIGHILETHINNISLNKIDKIGYEANPFKDHSNCLKNTFENELTTMYECSTGQKINNDIFFGVTYYISLKQQIDDKIFYRNEGRIKFLHKHPTEGKSDEGGLRLAHGAFDILQDKMVNETDNLEILVCKNCEYGLQRLLLKK